jgi:hypothetical protein
VHEEFHKRRSCQKEQGTVRRQTLVIEKHNHSDHNVHGIAGSQYQSLSLMAVLNMQLLKKGLPQVNADVEKT